MKIIKKIVIICILMLVMTGCSNSNDNSKAVQEIINPLGDVYESEKLNIEGYEGNPKIYKYKKDKIFFITDIITDISKCNVIQKLYSVNLDGSDFKEYILDFSCDEYISDFDIDDEGKIIYVINKVDGYSEYGSPNVIGYNIVKKNMDGKELHRIDCSSFLEEDGIFSVFYAKGNLIVGEGDDYFYCFNSDLSYIDKLQPKGLEYWIAPGVIPLENGNYLCNALNGDGTERNFFEIRFEDKTTEKNSSIKILSNVMGILPGFADYDFCFVDMSRLYGYNIENHKITGIIDLINSGILIENSLMFLPLEDGRFIGTEKDGKTGNKSFVIYTKQDYREQESRIEISYGTIGIEDDIYSAIREFNKSNDKYRIIIKDYINEEDPRTKMNLDIATGNIPDIIDLGACNSDEFISKGLVEDLTPFIDSDKDIKVSDFIPSVLEAMKINGKLYYIAPNLYVSTLVGSVSDVGKEKGWTFEEFKRVIKDSPEGVRPFLSNNRIDIFASLIDAGESDYIDWQNGKCTFNSDDYKDILNMAKELGVDEEFNYDDVDESEIKNGKVMFKTGFVDMTDIQMCDFLYDGKYNCIGYPNNEKNGSFFFFPIQGAIYSKSENKEGAWEFLRTLLTKEYQGLVMAENNVPTRQDCFDLMLEGAMTRRNYVNEIGKEIHVRDEEVHIGNKSVKLGPLSQEQANMYLDLINKTSKVGCFDDVITEILLEEAQDYFSDKNNLDKAVEFTQNRINTYINEKK